jgi:hypothetical protein
MIVVVGEALGTSRGRSTSEHLASLLGIDHDEMMPQLVWINLFDHPQTRIDRLVEVIKEAFSPKDIVLLLGRRVQRAFGFEVLKPLDRYWDSEWSPRFMMVPHPSGRNRWYNDPVNRAQACVELRVMWKRFS